MQWKKVPKHNEELLDRLLSSVLQAEKRRMFGCPAYFVNGSMLAGAHQDDIFLRLSEADQQEILKHPDAGHFTPMPGRPMREYIVIPPDVCESDAEFGKWLEKAVDYVLTIPPKEKKARK